MAHDEVFVADENGQPLSQCTQARAEALLKRGQAVWFCCSKAVRYDVRNDMND